MYNKKGIEANALVLIAVVFGLIIITAIFFLIYGLISKGGKDLVLNSYSKAEVRNLDNELYAILFGKDALPILIIAGEVITEKRNSLDSEGKKAMEYYKKGDRDYSLTINYKGEDPLVYGQKDLEGNPYVLHTIESSLKLPSLKYGFIEVKLFSGVYDLATYYGGGYSYF